jgi:GTPase SAR1 family protein
MGAVIVYDITDAASFQSVADKWIPLLRKHDSARNCAILLVGNKSDLEG